jgi:hypothetical protein
MGLGPALAILIIALFSVFVLWGRSPSGKAVLVRVFGEPKPPKTPRRTVSTKPARSTGGRTSLKKSADKPVTKRARRK